MRPCDKLSTICAQLNNKSNVDDLPVFAVHLQADALIAGIPEFLRGYHDWTHWAEGVERFAFEELDMRLLISRALISLTIVYPNTTSE